MSQVHKHRSRTGVQKSGGEVRKKKEVAKKVWIEEQCKNIEKGMSGNSKEAYNTLKSALTKKQQHRSAVIEDSSGNIQTESTAVLHRWT